MSQKPASPQAPHEALTQYARFAERLAAAAAEKILPHFRQPSAMHDKGGRFGFDPVTAADRDAETAMRELIEQAYPDHGIRGEEHADKPATDGFVWVLDPVDGTRSFVAGLPLWGTLIALNDGRRPVVGVIAQPVLNEIFVGQCGQDARTAALNGRTIRARPCGVLSEALIATTGLTFFTPEERAVYEAVEADARLSRYGGDCYSYAMLAAGHIDLVIEAGLQAHDIQALIPLIEGAGGIVTGWRGEDAQEGGRVVAAGDPRLHAQVLDRLAAVP